MESSNAGHSILVEERKLGSSSVSNFLHSFTLLSDPKYLKCSVLVYALPLFFL
jgi:hypothetical protein